MSAFNKYKANYAGLNDLPLVVNLKDKYKKARKKNRKLTKILIDLCEENRLLRNGSKPALIDLTKQPDEKDEDTPNISYEFIDDKSNTKETREIKLEKPKLERGQYIDRILEKVETNTKIEYEDEDIEIVEEEVSSDEEEMTLGSDEQELDYGELAQAKGEYEEYLQEKEEEEEEVVEYEEVEEEEVEEEEEEEVVEYEEVEEEEEDEVEEEEVVEEEEEDEDVEYEEVEEEDEDEEEEEGVYEIVINKKTYYVSNEVDSPIYAADENGDISDEVGIYKKGKPTFY